MGVQTLPKKIDYKEKRLLLHVLDATINKKSFDKVDDKKLIEYLSEAKESSKKNIWWIYFSYFVKRGTKKSIGQFL